MKTIVAARDLRLAGTALAQEEHHHARQSRRDSAEIVLENLIVRRHPQLHRKRRRHR